MYRPAVKAALGHAFWPWITRTAAARGLRGDTGLVFSFHYVGEPILGGVGGDLFLSAEAFRGTLDFICGELRPLPPDEFVARLRQGTLPERATLLTVDDTTSDAYTHTLPEFMRRGITGCFFVCPGLIQAQRTIPCLEVMDLCARAPAGRYRLALEGDTLDVTITTEAATRQAAYRQVFPALARRMSARHADLLASLRRQLGLGESQSHSRPLATWDQLDAMYRSGMWIANHTMSHSEYPVEGLEGFTREVSAADAILRERFPLPQRLFCYPYGSARTATGETAGILRGLGMDAAFVTQGGAARAGRHGLLELRREDANYSPGSAKLAALLALIR